MISSFGRNVLNVLAAVQPCVATCTEARKSFIKWEMVPETLKLDKVLGYPSENGFMHMAK